MSKLVELWNLMKRVLVYPNRRLRFGSYNINDYVESVKHITMESVYLGGYVWIGNNAWIEGVKKYNDVCFSPKIILHRGVSIQQNGHITCAQKIEIGANTAIAANVTITDINHPYEDITLPIEQQNIEVNPVYIGEDCKIYNNAVILPGVHIGRHCVIGANSVVNCDIPDNSIAVGAPAKVVKRFDKSKQQWMKVG